MTVMPARHGPEQFRAGFSALRSLRQAIAHRQLILAHGERRSANRSTWAVELQGGSVQHSASRPDDELTAATQVRLPAHLMQCDRECPILKQSYHSIVQDVLRASREIYSQFLDIDFAAAANLKRVQTAMLKQQVGPHHFAGSTGYGHGDIGRAAYESVRIYKLR
jgi:hypothetical protein